MTLTPQAQDWEENIRSIAQLYATQSYLNSEESGTQAAEDAALELLVDSVRALLAQRKAELLEALPREMSESEGWEAHFGSTERCCPGDDLAEGWNKAIKTTRRIIEESL